MRQVRQLLEKYTQLNLRWSLNWSLADVEQHKGTLTQMNTTLNHISDTIPQYENMFEELNLKIEILEVKTTADLYVWKVNNLSRYQHEARIGRRSPSTVLHSIPALMATVSASGHTSTVTELARVHTSLSSSC